MNFIDRIKAKAIELYKEWGILPSLTISQAILESSSGESGLTKRANNLFGVKGVGTAGSVEMLTTEEVNGKKVKVLANFRAYNSIDESLDDYGELLGKASRYKGVRESKDYKTALAEIQKSGYATDSEYSSKLAGIINQYQLWNIDSEVGGIVPSGGSSWGVGTARDDFGGNASEGEEGFFNMNPSGWLESVGEWFKSAGFVLIGGAILIVGILFLFNSGEGVSNG